MPVTPFSEVAGKACEQCGGPATHYYGPVLLCCDCHAGKGCGLFTRAEAEAEHRRVLASAVQREPDLWADWIDVGECGGG